MKYIFITYLFGVVDIDILFYKPGQTQKTFTYDNLYALFLEYKIV